MSEFNYQPCEGCKSYSGCPGLTRGFWGWGYYKSNRNGYPTAVECFVHKEREKQRYIKARKARSGIDYDSKKYNEDDNPNREALQCLLKYANEFEKFKTHTMVYLYGPEGTSKTTTVKHVADKILNKGYTVRYVTMRNLLDDLVTNYGDSEEKKIEIEERLQEYKKSDLLIIDDAFEKSKVTIYSSGFQLPYLYSFISDRYDTSGKAILFVSSVKPEEIGKNGFGDSLQHYIDKNTTESRLQFTIKRRENPKIDPMNLFKN